MGTEEIFPFLKCNKVQLCLVSSKAKQGLSDGQITECCLNFPYTSVLEKPGREGINVKSEP